MVDVKIEACRQALRALTQFMRPAAPLRRISVFLYIADAGPVTLDQIARTIGAPSGTVYDDLQAMGKVDANGKPGARLINEIRPVAEGQSYQYAVSVRGEQALAAMEFQMAAAMLPHDDDELDAYFESSMRRNPSDFSRMLASATDSASSLYPRRKMNSPKGECSFFSEGTGYGLQQRLSHDISSSLPSGLGTEISVQGTPWRGASTRARDHPTGLRRNGGDDRSWRALARSYPYVRRDTAPRLGQ